MAVTPSAQTMHGEALRHHTECVSCANITANLLMAGPKRHVLCPWHTEGTRGRHAPPNPTHTRPFEGPPRHISSVHEQRTETRRECLLRTTKNAKVRHRDCGHDGEPQPTPPDAYCRAKTAPAKPASKTPPRSMRTRVQRSLEVHGTGPTISGMRPSQPCHGTTRRSMADEGNTGTQQSMVLMQYRVRPQGKMQETQGEPLKKALAIQCGSVGQKTY